jgi:hypothetical protein
MAITVTSQFTGAQFTTTPQSQATSTNVTAGNDLLVPIFWFNDGGNDAPVAGDLTKTAGTSTIGTITIAHSSLNFVPFADTGRMQALFYRVPITGTGSLTLQIANMGTGGALDGFWMFLECTSLGALDGTPVSNSDTTQGGASPTTGSQTSTGSALFLAMFGDGGGNNTAIAGTGTFTQGFEQENGTTAQRGSITYRIVSTSTANNSGWTTDTTANAGIWLAIQACWAEAAAGGGNVLMGQVCT